MKKLYLLLFALLLTGCSLFPSKFDNQEHARLVDIHVMASDTSICENTAASGLNAQAMHRSAQWVEVYGKDLPNNQAMLNMQKNLSAMTRELHDRYTAGHVSVFYCKNKLENIAKATDAIIKVSARRPRI